MVDRQHRAVALGEGELGAVLAQKAHISVYFCDHHVGGLGRADEELVDGLAQGSDFPLDIPKVYHVAVVVDTVRAGDLDVGAVVVAVQALAEALVCDEVRAGELEVLLRHGHLELAHHRLSEVLKGSGRLGTSRQLWNNRSETSATILPLASP
jgi:hypothetical protein